jgi:ribosomal protein uL24
MKSDTERKKFYTEALHKRKSRLHVHLSKDLRSKLKAKKRALLVRKGDTVKVMRGPGKGKEAKVSDVNTIRRKVFVEGIVAKNARGREVALALEPSNLLLLSLEATKERREIFSEEAFRKAEAPKKEAAKAADAAAKPAAPEKEHAHEHAHSHEGHAHGAKEEHAANVHGAKPPASGQQAKSGAQKS